MVELFKIDLDGFVFDAAPWSAKRLDVEQAPR